MTAGYGFLALLFAAALVICSNLRGLTKLTLMFLIVVMAGLLATVR